MAIEDILQALDEEGRAECQAIFASAQEEVDRIIAEAEAEAERIRESKMERMNKEVDSERAALLYSARLEFKHRMIEAREEIVNEAFAKAFAVLSEARANGKYEKVLTELVREGLNKVSGVPVVHCDPADVDLTARCLSDLKVKGEVAPDIQCLGGAVVATEDERVRIVNTLEERLERAKNRLRMEVAEELFGSA
jgi:V/A-type H+-transporting ATPase subunit E